MHFHLPKPLHGWREFAGEVGIIVLGVLIALAADALIERSNWQRKVSLADANMRVEISGTAPTPRNMQFSSPVQTGCWTE